MFPVGKAQLRCSVLWGKLFVSINEQIVKTAQSIAKEENYSVVNYCQLRNFAS